MSDEAITIGLYRTITAYDANPEAFPAGRLIFVGKNDAGEHFMVTPQTNTKNQWFWREPVQPLSDGAWLKEQFRLREEGFYTLPETIHLDGGGKWLKNAIVQLGYDTTGKAILFVAERHASDGDNILRFSNQGLQIDDALLERLTRAPILPVARPPQATLH